MLLFVTLSKVKGLLFVDTKRFFVSLRMTQINIMFSTVELLLSYS